jgi:hypothetical protein
LKKVIRENALDDPSLYDQAFEWAVDQLKKNLAASQNKKKCSPGFGSTAVYAQMLAKFGTGPSHTTINDTATGKRKKAAKKHKPGPDKDMPLAIEDYLELTIREMRLSNIMVYRCQVIDQAKALITDTRWQDMFLKRGADGKPVLGAVCAQTGKVLLWDEQKFVTWYQRYFLKRPGIKTMDQKTLTCLRDKWCTAENFRRSYKVWGDAHVKHGIAYENNTGPERFDENCTDFEDPRSCQILFHKDKMKYSASFDETRVESDTGANRSNRSEQTVTVGEDDKGECLSSRGGIAMTGVGGSFLDLAAIRCATRLYLFLPTVRSDACAPQANVRCPARGDQCAEAHRQAHAGDGHRRQAGAWGVCPVAEWWRHQQHRRRGHGEGDHVAVEGPAGQPVGDHHHGRRRHAHLPGLLEMVPRQQNLPDPPLPALFVEDAARRS